MSRPKKRPRLHFMGSVTPEPDVELELARQRNDYLLKTRWENVFQRYEKDFTGIGDEIGVLSGQVEVDNGHLRSMQNEKDTGETTDAPSASRFDGRRMLRAMTVAPSECSDSIPDADEVLQSIETIADNAMLSDYSSEDDLFGPPAEMLLDGQSPRSYTEESDEQDSMVKERRRHDTPERALTRSPSADSLFNLQSHDITPNYANSRHRETTRESSIPPQSSFSDQSNRIKRSSIRAEVRRILQEEKVQNIEAGEERVEPAWRIPIRLSPSSFLAPRIASSNVSPADAEADVEIVENMSTDNSIWVGPTRARRPRRKVVAQRNLKIIRAESEDPLQQGFSSDPETSLRAQSATLSKRDRLVKQSLNQRVSVPQTLQIQTSNSHRFASSSAHTFPSDLPSQTVTKETPLDVPLHQWTRGPADNEQQILHNNATSYSGIGLDGSSSPTAVKRRAEGSADWSPDNSSEDEDFDDVQLEQDPRREGSTGQNSNLEADNQLNPVDEISLDDESTWIESIEKFDKSGKNRKPLPRVSKLETFEDKSNHPWQTPTTRTGRPLGELSKSHRRKNAEKYTNQSNQPATSQQSPTLAVQEGHATNTTPANNDAVLSELEKQKILKPMRQGICYYCKGDHHDKNGVGSHWDRVLTNFAVQTLDDDDPHDMVFIHSVRSQVQRRVRPPKTILADFRLMIELHEGRNMSFKDIASSRLLWSQKNAEQLEKEYATYRQIPLPGQTRRNWTNEEVRQLNQTVAENLTSKNKKITMIRLHRDLGRRSTMSFIDLGNRLAEMFLEEFYSKNASSERQETITMSSTEQTPTLPESHADGFVDESVERGELSVWQVHNEPVNNFTDVKIESCDDSHDEFVLSHATIRVPAGSVKVGKRKRALAPPSSRPTRRKEQE